MRLRHGGVDLRSNACALDPVPTPLLSVPRYTRFSAQQGWRFEVLEIAESEMGGYKVCLLSRQGLATAAALSSMHCTPVQSSPEWGKAQEGRKVAEWLLYNTSQTKRACPWMIPPEVSGGERGHKWQWSLWAAQV